MELELVYSRYQYILDLFTYRGEEEQARDRSYLMLAVNGLTEDMSYMDDMLQKYSVDYIIVENTTVAFVEYLQKNDWSIVDNSGQYTLYQMGEGK